MRIIQKSLALLLLTGSLLAQTPDKTPSPKEIAIDGLLSERGAPSAMDAAIAKAKAAGVGPQAILEARLLYHVDRREDAALAAMLPDFLARDADFKIADSTIFSSREDWLAAVEYVRAIDALEKGDKAAFKNHITEAFWLSPRQGAAFAPHIERLRLDDAMKSVRVDFSKPFRSLTGSEPVALREILGKKKALILHFWSPASMDSAGSLPDYAIAAAELGSKGVAMVSLLPADAPDALLEDARKALAPLEPKPPGAWLIDRAEGPLFQEMRIRSMPVFVLVSKEGRVLYNGDPGDDALWEALARLDPALVRPAMEKEAD